MTNDKSLKLVAEVMTSGIPQTGAKFHLPESMVIELIRRAREVEREACAELIEEMLEPWLLKEYIDKTAQAIRATGEPEPVAWMTINEYGEEDDIHYENPEGHLLEGWTYKPLYTHPPSVQPKPEPLEYWNAVEGWVKIDEVPGERMKKEWGRLEPIRIRIMSEAYDLADRGDSEGYNSVKVMCSDVLALIKTEFAQFVEAKLKEKNT
jgi:hypothetical protein